MRGAIFDFFALCFLLFLILLAGRHSDSTPGNYCCLFPLYGQEWTWCCSRMDIHVCVFSLSVFFVVVCTIFVSAVFLWAPEHFRDHGLDLWDQLIMWEFNSIQFNLPRKQYILQNITYIYAAKCMSYVCLIMMKTVITTSRSTKRTLNT